MTKEYDYKTSITISQKASSYPLGASKDVKRYRRNPRSTLSAMDNSHNGTKKDKEVTVIFSEEESKKILKAYHMPYIAVINICF